MKKLINNFLEKFGYQIKPSYFFQTDLKRRIKIVKSLNIDVLFDIGSNTGQYAEKMREFGYNGKIISFEPLATAFKTLQQNSINDNNWIANNYALGSEDTKGVINVSENMDSSSLLNILPEHVKNAPHSKYVGQQEIEIKKLDSVFDSFCNKENNVMLKIDTQGYEESVLKGAFQSLSRIKMIQLEMSIVPLYENEMLFVDMINYLDSKGFCLYSLENGFSNPNTGRLLQVDGIFVNKTYADI